MNDFRPSLDWRIQLREHRVRLGVPQAELARRSALSLRAIKSYESGERRPSAEALDKMLTALGLSPEQANPIRAGAGYAINFSALFDNRYIFDIAIAQQQLDKLPWPAYITNQATLVVAYNRPFETLLDVDIIREFPDPEERNLIAYASDPRFTRGLENFDEVVGMLIGLAKGDPRVDGEVAVDRATPWTSEAVAKFMQGDPAFIRPFLELWEKQAAIPHRTRHVYEVHWRHRGETPSLKFIATLSPADIWNELWWNEWCPKDTDTAARLAAIMA